jgi:DNA helicase II / ATP-dependent DNA helicase PcrA
MDRKQINRYTENYRAYLEAGLPPFGSVEHLLSCIQDLDSVEALAELRSAVQARLSQIHASNNVIEFPQPNEEINYQELLGIPHPLSKHQKGVLDWVLFGQGNAAVNAVAGSGKSTTLVYATIALAKLKELQPDDIRLVVFGRENSKDLRGKLVTALGNSWDGSTKTMHSMGFAALKEELGEFAGRGYKYPPAGMGRIDNYKYHKICKALGYADDRDRSNPGSMVTSKLVDKPSTFFKLVDFCRFQLVNFSANDGIDKLRQMINHFGDQFDGVAQQNGELAAIAQALAKVLERGKQQAAQEKVIDFADQIWLPVVWHLNERSWWHRDFTFRFMFVDECQDFNACQRQLSLMMAGDHGRLLYVGDRSQSIMGFAGADCESFELIVEDANCIEMPLSVCYRCPKRHIELIQSEFPNIPIQAFENAPDGEIAIIKEDDLWNNDIPHHLQEGDLVLCRKTAPLISMCIKLISNGIAASVKGRDIGKSLIGELESVTKLMHQSVKRGFVNAPPSFLDFPDYLIQYRDNKIKGYQNLDNSEQLVEALNDKVDALLVLFERYPFRGDIDTGVKALTEVIESLFSDATSPITLSTSHRAKGLEADRVFIIQPSSLPLVWNNQQLWQADQEDNLLYVTLSRSKKALYVVMEKDKNLPDWAGKIKLASAS